MISPKYNSSHCLYPLTQLVKSGGPPHVVNLYLDYACPFSAKIFIKFKSSVIPEIEKKYSGKFQFVFMNVIQPWHPNSVYMHEFSLSIAKLIRETDKGNSELFWSVSESLFKNIKKFYDNANSDVGRNAIYSQLYDVVSEDVKIPFSKDEILDNLTIKQVGTDNEELLSNDGNAVGADVKYFTKFHRTVGVHVTPTVSVNGITDSTIESSTEPEVLVKKLGSYL